MKLILLLTISITFLLFETRASLKKRAPDAENKNTEKVNCLIDFLDYKFKHHDLFIYSRLESTELEIEMIKQLNVENKRTLRIVNAETVQECKYYNEIYKQYLIFIDTAKGLNDIFEMCFSPGPRTTSPLLLIVADDTKEVMGIMKILKSYKLYLSSLVTKVSKRTLSLYDHKGDCNENTNFSTSFYNCQNFNEIPSFLLLNSNVCNLRVGIRIAPPFTFELPLQIMRKFNLKRPYLGTEMKILTEMLDVFNQKAHFISYNYSMIGNFDDKTETGSGVINELVKGELDLIFGAMNLCNYSKYIQPAHCSCSSNLIAIVKKRKDVELTKVFNTFSLNIWLFISLTFLMLACFPYIISRIYKISRLTNSVTFKLFTILLGQGINFNRKHFRLLFLSWIWFTYLLRSCYEAKITSLFVERDSSRQVNDLNEICEDKYTIFIDKSNTGVKENALKFLNCNFSSILFVHVKDPLNALLSTKNNLVAAFMYKEIYIQKLGTLNQHSIQNLHVIKESLEITQFYYYSRAGEQFSSAAHKVWQKLHESDIFNVYKRFINHYMKLWNKNNSTDEPLHLTMKNVYNIFILYASCIIINVLCFITEIIIHKMQKCSNSFKNFFSNLCPSQHLH